MGNYFLQPAAYEGSRNNDGKPHGSRGIFRYANGDCYVGDVANGNPNGKGVMRLSNGDSYNGDWIDAKEHGKGIFQ